MTVLRLTYRDLAARLELITRWFPRLPARCFFVDVPIDGVPGLEVVQLDDAGAEGAWTLDPRLFGGEAAPEWYLMEMVDASARAAALLSSCNGSVSEVQLAEEIAAIYARLVPRHDERVRALDLYVMWLTTTDGAAVRTDTAVERDMFVARLAHTQAVRLRGPDYPGGLAAEAALVRKLTSSARAKDT